MKLHPIAIAAARAARNWSSWGPYAARRYAERHGVPSGILTLARVLAAAERNGVPSGILTLARVSAAAERVGL